MEALAPSEGKHVDAMLGLVAEFSQTPYIENREFISPMRGVLHSGHVCGQENGLLTFEAMNYNLHELPKCFGGMSRSRRRRRRRSASAGRPSARLPAVRGRCRLDPVATDPSATWASACSVWRENESHGEPGVFGKKCHSWRAAVAPSRARFGGDV